MVNPSHACDIAEKVAYLRQPAAFPDRPDAVEVVETHFAWIFLSRRYVYKLKKPIRFLQLDLTTAAARRSNCELEVALNRRLAADTYVGVVALGRHGSELRLELDENPVDWLVKMHRLPREATLENLLPTIDTDDPRLAVFVDTLCAFYRNAVRAPWNADDFARSLRRESLTAADRLNVSELESDRERVHSIVAGQVSFVEQHYALLAERIASRHVRDAHGDLRPEHVFLTNPPQIIDCLEFSAELRQLDTAEEISFLTLECRLRERPDVAERLRRLYAAFCEDSVPEHLYDYYTSRRALVRAFLCASHFAESTDEDIFRHWLDQTRRYIAAAESSIARAIH
jgi:aminoglycoside phosphotransferase family enzyme